MFPPSSIFLPYLGRSPALRLLGQGSREEPVSTEVGLVILDETRRVASKGQRCARDGDAATGRIVHGCGKTASRCGEEPGLVHGASHRWQLDGLPEDRQRSSDPELRT